MTMTKNQLRLAAAVLALSLGTVPTLGNAADNLTAAERAHMNALSQQLGDDNAQAQPVETADLFGPSDADKAAAAAAAQREQNQDANIATLNQRAGDIEDQFRKLTGQIEVLNHRLDEMDQRIDRMQKDFDYKLCTMSAQQLGATPGQPSAIPCTGGRCDAARGFHAARAAAGRCNAADRRHASGAAAGRARHVVAARRRQPRLRRRTHRRNRLRSSPATTRIRNSRRR